MTQDPMRLPAPKRVLPLSPSSSVAVRSFVETNGGYTREQAIEEARRAGTFDFAPTRGACPFQVDVNGLVSAVARGDFDAALEVVLASHPWPGILGRHCFRPCEWMHKLGPGIETLNISGLERSAQAFGRRAAFPFAPGSATSKRVAILGAGSAASAAAYRLRQHGHHVAVYEQLPVSGGMMFAGYPEFRLPLAVLREENDLESWGVETHYGQEITPGRLQCLVEEYDAVLLGTGKFKGERLGLPGEELDGVWDALDYLTQWKLGQSPAMGARVVVVGAGYTAQDAARTCLRRGATEVKVVYRRLQDHMPVFPGLRNQFVQMMIAEGAPYVWRTMPTAIVGKGGKAVGLSCVRTRPVRGDDGKESVEAVPGTEFFLACDTVIEAVGEKVDLSMLPPQVRIKEDNTVWTDGSLMTSLPKLFAAGELTGVGGTVYAFQAGFQVGEYIDQFVRKGASR